MTPVPEKVSVPVVKFVPETVMLPVNPCLWLVRLIDAGTGAPDVTVNAPARVPVVASAFVTTTSRAVRAAAALIVMFAVIVVLFWTEYELTVMPVPENDNVPALKLDPVTVTLPVNPCASDVAAIDAG